MCQVQSAIETGAGSSPGDTLTTGAADGPGAPAGPGRSARGGPSPWWRAGPRRRVVGQPPVFAFWTHSAESELALAALGGFLGAAAMSPGLGSSMV